MKPSHHLRRVVVLKRKSPEASLPLADVARLEPEQVVQPERRI